VDNSDIVNDALYSVLVLYGYICWRMCIVLW